jgi:hypothetical protein
MKKINTIFVTLILISAFFTACKNDDKQQSFDSSILINHTWKISACTIEPAADIDDDGVVDTNPYELIYGNTCWQNNYLSFNADFTAHYNQLCGEMIQDFTWQFTNDNSKIKFGLQTADILLLDNSTFKISLKTEEDNGTVYTTTTTYSAR